MARKTYHDALEIVRAVPSISIGQLEKKLGISKALATSYLMAMVHDGHINGPDPILGRYSSSEYRAGDKALTYTDIKTTIEQMGDVDVPNESQRQNLKRLAPYILSEMTKIDEAREVIKAAYATAKAGGINPQAFKKTISILRKSPAEHAIMNNLIDQYMLALGQLIEEPRSDTPVFDAASKTEH